MELEWDRADIMIRALKRFFRKREFDCDDVADQSSAYIENDLKD